MAGKGHRRRPSNISNKQYQDNWDLVFVERRSIPGFPGYKATKIGRVWSDKTGEFLTPSIGHGGYPRVSLYKEGGETYKNPAPNSFRDFCWSLPARYGM